MQNNEEVREVIIIKETINNYKATLHKHTISTFTMGFATEA